MQEFWAKVSGLYGARRTLTVGSVLLAAPEILVRWRHTDARKLGQPNEMEVGAPSRSSISAPTQDRKGAGARIRCTAPEVTVHPVAAGIARRRAQIRVEPEATALNQAALELSDGRPHSGEWRENATEVPLVDLSATDLIYRSDRP